VPFHATCAQNKGLIREIIMMKELQGERDAPPVYCKTHLKKKSPKQYGELLKIEKRFEKYKTGYSYLLIKSATLKKKEHKTTLERNKERKITSEAYSKPSQLDSPSRNKRKARPPKSRENKIDEISEPRRPIVITSEKPARTNKNIPCTFKPEDIPKNILNPEEASNKVDLYKKVYKYLRDCDGESDKREKCYFKPRPVLGLIMNFNQWAERKIIAMVIAEYIVMKHDLYNEKDEVLEVHRNPLLEDLFGAQNILKRDIFKTFSKYMRTSTVPSDD